MQTALLTLALTEGLVARVVFVPSTARRTLMLASAIGVALIAGVFLTRFYEPGRGANAAFLSSAVTAAWWAVTTIVCVSASRVIYGLRKQVTDADLVHLKEMTSLESLTLSYTQVSDAGLGHLKGMTSLQMLFLSYTKVSDAGLAHLKGLTQIRRLSLFYART